MKKKKIRLPEGERFFQDINEVIRMFPEESSDKVLRCAEE